MAPPPGVRTAGNMAMPVAAPLPPAHDPYVTMKPPAGKRFDLRAVDDGVPAENVRQRGGKAGVIIGVVLMVVGGGIGYGFGAAAVGRRAYNSANMAAKSVKTDLEQIQKTVVEIGTAVAMSGQRLQGAKMDPLSFDPQLIEDLAKVKLDPRPDTARVFKVDYYRLPDMAVDRLMNYYYDTIALYGEVERHIRRTKADKESLEAFAQKQAAKAANYGVVFDARGKLAIGSLVEVGVPVCKGGGSDCGADKLEGFQIRSNTGASWSPRKISAKVAGDIVVPLDHTPLFDAVMSGSPDQVRMEQYKQRFKRPISGK